MVRADAERRKRPAVPAGAEPDLEPAPAELIQRGEALGQLNGLVQRAREDRAAAPQALPAYLALARLKADRALAAGTLSAPDAQRMLGVLAGPRE